MPKGSGRTNKLRYGGANDPGMEELFGGSRSIFQDDDPAGPAINVDDLEDIYELDLETIGKDANIMASSNIQNLLRCYNSKEFVEEHPDFKRRIDTEIEGLRKCYKLAKIDEEIHDHLVHAISKNPSNASLYMAHVRLQEKMLAIDKEIRDRIAGFNKIISGYQLELNFAESSGSTSDNGNTAAFEDGAVMSRGSKAFIEQMKSEVENQQLDLFEHTEEDEEDEE